MSMLMAGFLPVNAGHTYRQSTRIEATKARAR